MQLELLDLEALRVERAHDPGEVGLARAQPHGDAALGAARLAEAGEDRGGPLAVGGVGGNRLDRRPADVAFSAAGVPSATIRPWSMIPTRSASTSASSRYCVVRKTVTPSSRASRATSSQSAVRLWMSSPVVGSSRKRIRGEWTSASARSRRRFIPPE